MNLSELTPQLRTCEQKLRTIQNEASEAEGRKIAEMKSLEESVNRINVYEREIQNYEKQEIPLKLESVQRDLRSMHSELQANQEKADSLSDRIDKFQKQLSEVQILQRTIEDNIKVRQLQRDVTKIESSVKQYRAHLMEIDHESIQDRYHKLKQKHEMLVGEVRTF
jgi:chromosome segregation ATPase